MRRAVLALAATATLGARPVGAQVVQGRVVSAASGRPLPDVPVRLLRATPADTAALPADTNAVSAARTGRDGVFTLIAPDTGVYRPRIGYDFMGSVMHLGAVDAVDVREYRLRMPDVGALFAFEVEKQAGLLGGLTTRYPSTLRSRGVTGRVVAQFVVDTTGRADPATFRVLESTDPLFSAATREAIGAARFSPAQVAGRTVRQLVQLPVTFSIDGGAGVLRSPFAAVESPFPPRPPLPRP